MVHFYLHILTQLKIKQPQTFHGKFFSQGQLEDVPDCLSQAAGYLAVAFRYFSRNIHPLLLQKLPDLTQLFYVGKINTALFSCFVRNINAFFNTFTQQSMTIKILNSNGFSPRMQKKCLKKLVFTMSYIYFQFL